MANRERSIVFHFHTCRAAAVEAALETKLGASRAARTSRTIVGQYLSGGSSASARGGGERAARSTRPPPSLGVARLIDEACARTAQRKGAAIAVAAQRGGVATYDAARRASAAAPPPPRYSPHRALLGTSGAHSRSATRARRGVLAPSFIDRLGRSVAAWSP